MYYGMALILTLNVANISWFFDLTKYLLPAGYVFLTLNLQQIFVGLYVYKLLLKLENIELDLLINMKVGLVSTLT